MEFNVINTVTLIAGFVAFLLMVFLLSLRTERRLTNYLLVVYLFGFILDTLSQFVTEYVYPLSPIAGMFISLSVFLIIPSIYLFVKSSIYSDFTLSAGSFIHLLPYTLMILILIPGYFAVHLRGEFTPEYAEEFRSGSIIKLLYVSIYIQLLVYYTLIFIELRRYRQLLIENSSNPNMGNYRWLMQFVILLVALDLIGLIKNILRFSSSELIFNAASLIVVINILIFISWVLIMSMKEPGMFTGIFSDMQLIKNIIQEGESESENERKSNGELISEESAHLIEKLRKHMESNEPFLDSSLNMYDLAGQLDMKVRDLSLLINHTLNQHFFDFVNQYRIEKAKEMLKDPENKQITVLEVLYEVGFNSKSSFNTVFKKQTGLTPTQFRKT